MVQTDIIFEKYSPNQPHPFPIPAPAPFIHYTEMYSPIPTSEESEDSDFSALVQQVEALRRTLLVPANGISLDSFCPDTWGKVLRYLLPREAFELQLVSKNLMVLVTQQDGFWKEIATRRCSNCQSLLSVSRFSSWLMKFKLLTLALENNETRTVIDIGSDQTKYISFNKISKILDLKCVPSLYTTKFTMGLWESLLLGVGNPIDRNDLAVLYGVCNTFSKVCFLLEPGEVLHRFFLRTNYSRWEIRFCHASVGALCAFNRKSGIVVSIGHSKSWIEVVDDSNPIWHFRIEQKGKILEDLKPEIIKLLVSQYFFKFPEASGLPTLPPLEFCCIGGAFNEAAVRFFSHLVSQKTSRFQIISTVENRICAPVVGAYFAPLKNLHKPADLLPAQQKTSFYSLDGF